MIDNVGMLAIERGGEMKSQWCPFHNEGEEPTLECGDWCPLFGEPVLPFSGEATVELDICKKTLPFDEFTDEREKEKE